MREKRILIWMCASIIPLIMTEAVLNVLNLSEKVLGYIRIMDCVMLVSLYLWYRQKPSGIMMLFGGIYGTILISALANDTFNLTVLNIVGGLCACMVFDFWLNREFDKFIEVLRYILVSLVVANFITIVLFPNGIYGSRLYSENWLLGHKNSHVQYIFMALLLEMIYLRQKRKKNNAVTILLFVISCSSLLLANSLMSFIVVFFLCIALVLYSKKDRCRIFRYLLRVFNYKLILAVTIVGFLGIFLIYENDVLIDITTKLSNMLGRSTPFNGRLPIWRAALDLISQSPIIGHGVVDPEVFVKLSGIGGGTHSHSYILNLLIVGGLICLIEHIVLYGVMIRKFDQSSGMISYMMAMTIALYFFGGLTNVNFYAIFYNPIFVLAYYTLRNKVGELEKKVK